MELIFRKNDIAEIIKTYYRKLEGFDVDVIITDDLNIDKTFLLQYNLEDRKVAQYIPACKINEIIRKCLNSFGFTVHSINTNFGGKHHKTSRDGETFNDYIPTFQKVTVECEFTKVKSKSITK